MTGFTSLTSRVNDFVALPAEFVAVTASEYDVLVVGLPEIFPAVVKVKPSLRPVMLQVMGLAPLALTVKE